MKPIRSEFKLGRFIQIQNTNIESEDFIMPQNRRESLIYTVLMCTFMVFVMSVYNVALNQGFAFHAVREAWLGFPIAFAVAIVLDWFVVSGPAKKIAFSILKPEDANRKKAIIVSSFMVTGMVILMSLFGAIAHGGISKMTLMLWLINIPKNFIMAYPLQLLIARPLIQFIFRKAFPVGCIAG